MSKKKTISIPQRFLWEDRWNKPKIKQLFEPLKEQYQKALPNLIANILAFDGISKTLVWKDAAWKWTIQFELALKPKSKKTPFAYLVANPERPVFCLPLKTETIDALPMKQFNKYVREGIKDAKYGVEINWCTWSPSAQTEVDYLTELITHIYNMTTKKK